MESTLVLAVLAICVAAFTQSTVGFGTAMVGMPLLVGIVGIQVAAPLVALVGLTTEILLLIFLRGHLDLRVIGRLVLAATAGVPVGIFLIKRLDEAVVLAVLGVVLVAYALYNLIGFKMPPLVSPVWAYVLGFSSGVLGGAYNTSGPPVVIYGTGRRWSPDEFRANLQAFFLVIDVIVVGSHAVAGNLTATVWRTFLFGLIGLGVGMALGLVVGKRINPETFRRIILALLIVLGTRLLFDAVMA